MIWQNKCVFFLFKNYSYLEWTYETSIKRKLHTCLNVSACAADKITDSEIAGNFLADDGRLWLCCLETFSFQGSLLTLLKMWKYEIDCVTTNDYGHISSISWHLEYDWPQNYLGVNYRLECLCQKVTFCLAQEKLDKRKLWLNRILGFIRKSAFGQNRLIRFDPTIRESY